MTRSRYIIGIDLGTSNCACAFIDTESADAVPREFLVPQYTAPGVLVESPVLPSFAYIPPLAADGHIESALRCEFQSPGIRAVTGEFARAQSPLTPGRVITSAKSWLCHRGVDRTARILPWNSPDVTDEQKLSPVEASALYLEHIKAAWNFSLGRYHPAYRFEEQDITITVPASFDEDALELTLQAAKFAGYPEGVRLLEEPQAALYAYLGANAGQVLFEQTSGKVTLLVSDVGGGTSDFSLFEAEPDPQSGMKVTRVAVSDHILLGGDNIDLLLAYTAEGRLREQSGAALTPRQWSYLVHSCRGLKERILSSGNSDHAEYEIAIPSEGSNLFAATLSVKLHADEIRSIVLDGFFPLVESIEAESSSAPALQEWGLPYAKEPAVTKHLKRFLDGKSVDFLLCNGGTLLPQMLRERVTQALALWQGGKKVSELQAGDYTLGVALGAARYGLALRNHRGVIAGGYARSLYVQVDDPSDETAAKKLLCIVPHGLPVNERVSVENSALELRLGQPVSFELFSTRLRPNDRVGTLTTLSEQFHPLPPLQTVLKVLGTVPKTQSEQTAAVHLEASFDEVGLLRLACVSKDREQQWQLSFNVRGEAATKEALTPELPSDSLEQAKVRIELYFGKGQANDQQKPGIKPSSVKYLVQELEDILRTERSRWDVASLRSLWPALRAGITRRGRSVQHEASWLYLAGFLLRPGYGTDLDKHFVAELWRAFELGLAHPKENHVFNQWWIMWRRVAGGLTAAQQELLFDKAFASYKQRGDEPELLRALCSLERVSHRHKSQIGESLLAKICGRKKGGVEHCIWSLGRIGSRIPLYGSAHQVVPPETAAAWFTKLAALDWREKEFRPIVGACVQLCRRTGDRTRDLPEEVLEQALSKVQISGGNPQQVQMLREVVEVTAADTVQLFGEELPAGLKLIRVPD